MPFLNVSRLNWTKQGIDVDCNVNGAVMELEFDDGSKIIVNRHTPNQEMWIAAQRRLSFWLA